jgi:hypothetical protein
VWLGVCFKRVCGTQGAGGSGLDVSCFIFSVLFWASFHLDSRFVCCDGVVTGNLGFGGISFGRFGS